MGHEPRNLLIQGENLEVLRSLTATHAGQVRLIYIDPPYNTGSGDYLYADAMPREQWLRFMVERLEGFCSENDWQRAYNEMNEFEKELADWGAGVIKFWVQIDNETQLQRFTDRQNTPEKQWKITDEDWRNREKWDQYEEAVNEMLQKTNTTFAPWYILESNDKKYARIKALRIVVDSLKKACKEN